MAGQPRLWVAAERRALFEPRPPSDESLIEIVRGRLEGLGPVTASALAQLARLARIEDQTSPWAGSRPRALPCAADFSADGAQAQAGQPRKSGASAACSRASIATPSSVCAPRSSRCRRGISAFLCEWQRVLPESRMQGSDALAAVLTQLEGFEAPAGAWETEIIPSRIAEYEPQWLDEHCRAGRFVWTRLCGARRRRMPPIPNAAAALRRFVPRPSPCWRGAACRSGRP